MTPEVIRSSRWNSATCGRTPSRAASWRASSSIADSSSGRGARRGWLATPAGLSIATSQPSSWRIGSGGGGAAGAASGSPRGIASTTSASWSGRDWTRTAAPLSQTQPPSIRARARRRGTPASAASATSSRAPAWAGRTR